jgi:hypothetical protein
MQTAINIDLESLRLRLYRLSTISPEAVQRVAEYIEKELTRAGGSAASLSNLEREIAAKMGVDPNQIALVKARAAANQRVIDGIPRDKLQMLKCLHGEDLSKIAAAWLSLRSITGARQ